MRNDKNHPDYDKLLQYAEAKLSAGEHVRLADHVENCAICQQKISLSEMISAHLNTVEVSTSDDFTTLVMSALRPQVAPVHSNKSHMVIPAAVFAFLIIISMYWLTAGADTNTYDPAVPSTRWITNGIFSITAFLSSSIVKYAGAILLAASALFYAERFVDDFSSRRH